MLDSDEEKQIRLSKVKAKEDRDLAQGIALSKEQADFEKALLNSKLEFQNSAKKTSANDGSPKKSDLLKEQPQEDEDLELLHLYMRGKDRKLETKIEEKPHAPSKQFKAVNEVKKLSKSKPKNAETDKAPVIYGPLSGKTIVITGQFQEGRPKIENMFINLGAIIRQSVSKKTDYVIQGIQLEDGR